MPPRRRRSPRKYRKPPPQEDGHLRRKPRASFQDFGDLTKGRGRPAIRREGMGLRTDGDGGVVASMRMGLSTREIAPMDLIWKKRWSAGVRACVRDGNVEREGMMGFGRAVEVGRIGRWVLVGD
ncbi:uncharacterized protein LOC126624549 [Malus sylvestris]|uniref:uncharacterized protein LOC126624549 n=1 Tax=Malus sylvestris TaxID=3752 RepID=UPI0010AB2217|nr:uncharacterized protein LOC114824947 [Malus domestica]XP_050149580.1 uncharacterized protein LOC126624549 [Malus sylvestris]